VEERPFNQKLSQGTFGGLAPPLVKIFTESGKKNSGAQVAEFFGGRWCQPK
jgi:hypothetical protein